MMRSIFLLFFFIVFSLFSCRSKSDQLKAKLTLLLPKNTNQVVLDICKKYIDDCVLMYKEVPLKNAKRKASNEDYEKAMANRKKFTENYPKNFMTKTTDQIFAEYNISDKDEKKIITDFLQRMMEAYFQFIQ